MDICTLLEDIISLAETANDANYHEKLDVIVIKAKAAKLQIDDSNKTAKVLFDEFEKPTY